MDPLNNLSISASLSTNPQTSSQYSTTYSPSLNILKDWSVAFGATIVAVCLGVSVFVLIIFVRFFKKRRSEAAQLATVRSLEGTDTISEGEANNSTVILSNSASAEKDKTKTFLPTRDSTKTFSTISDISESNDSLSQKDSWSQATISTT